LCTSPHGKRFGEDEGVGWKRYHHGLAGTSTECAGKWGEFDRRLGVPVELVDERPKLGWVIVAHLIMSKKLFLSFLFGLILGVAFRIAGRLSLFPFSVFSVEGSKHVGCVGLVGILIKLIDLLLEAEFVNVYIVFIS
jgi:hypothetical protein